ncbi:hypothetical protein [Pseudomonas lundensis]|uniref:hypothetical protein n=1 Tax=Pseudomonas lundensis TaxID=86185 RepID=UPI000BA1E639|nr:hypothetical protein [Pseudomonas lundensis]OZY50349.1 hypothetical protein CJF34_12280 [Pseudomonas lundensis]
MKLYYDVAFHNTPIWMAVSIVFEGGSINAVVGELPDVEFELTPRGGGMEAIMSTILEPIAEKIVNDNAGALEELIGSNKFEVMKVESIPFNNMQLSLDSLSTGSHDVDGEDVFKILPKLTVTAAPAGLNKEIV